MTLATGTGAISAANILTEGSIPASTQIQFGSTPGSPNIPGDPNWIDVMEYSIPTPTGAGTPGSLSIDNLHGKAAYFTFDVKGGNGDGEAGTQTNMVEVNTLFPYMYDDIWFGVDVQLQSSDGCVGTYQTWRCYFRYGNYVATVDPLDYNRQGLAKSGGSLENMAPGIYKWCSGTVGMYRFRPAFQRNGNNDIQGGYIRVYCLPTKGNVRVWASWQYNGADYSNRKNQISIRRIQVFGKDSKFSGNAAGGGKPTGPISTNYAHIQFMGSKAQYDAQYPNNKPPPPGVLPSDKPPPDDPKYKDPDIPPDEWKNTCCFDPEALVTMSDNTKKKIKDIIIGDKVKNSKSGTNTVLGIETPVLGKRKMYKYNNKWAFVSEEHPLLTTEGWAAFNPDSYAVEEEFKGKLKKIEVGTVLVTDWGYEQITSIEAEDKPEEYNIYNLMLDGDHTFIVEDVIVHNKKIICTKLHEWNDLPTRIWKADERYAALLIKKDPDIYLGYIAWSRLVVELMEGKGPLLAWFMGKEKGREYQTKTARKWAKLLGTSWAEEMAHKLGILRRENKLGKFLLAVGTPICKLIGMKQRIFNTIDSPAGYITGYSLWLVFGLLVLSLKLKVGLEELLNVRFSNN